MNLKTIAILVSAPAWLPMLFVVLLLAAMVIALAAVLVPLSDDECVEYGIVPSRHRYDQDFIERVRARAMGGEG